MTSGTTLEQAVQDYVRARAQNPKLTPEEFCRDAPDLLPGLVQVLQAVTAGLDGQTVWHSEVGERVSYFVITGATADDIYAGYRKLTGVTPRRHLVEIRTSEASSYELGQELTVTTFESGQDVDVVGTTKGKGFAGVMKRHGFHGVSSSHGSHKNHRKPGSIGACATPGRVFKGHRMAGRMGGVRQTTQNLTIYAVDADRGLLLIKGAVPGPRGGVVLVRTAAKGV